MNARIIPFPMNRRAIVKNLARQLLCYRQNTAERALDNQLEFQRQSLLRKGVAPDAVGREIAALEYAVRAALWNMTMFGGDAA